MLHPSLSIVSAALLAFLATRSNAQLTYPLDSTVLAIDVVVDSDRVNIPWEILWGPDDRLWMTDGPLITRWDPVTDVIDTLLDRGYGNGLGMALHPDFPNTPIVMAMFDTSAYYASGQLCEVSRFTYDAINDTLIDEQVLFTYYHGGEHAGGRVLFDTTGNVLITTADYYFNGPDTLFSTNGKTLRFATDGSVPPDNPRADHTWTWGHRNPQGLAMLPNGAIVNSEHGQLYQGNEINLIQRDEDHGYPYYDGNSCFILPDTCTSATYSHIPPLWAFTQPPSGIAFHSSNAIPEFEGKLITCILWQTGLVLFTFNTALDSITATEHLTGGAFADMGRLRDIAIKPDGSFYLITNDRQQARIRWVHPDFSTEVAPLVTQESAIRIWPNPTTDRVTIAVEGDAHIELLDAMGRVAPVPLQRVGDRYLMDVGGCVAGLYAIRISQRGQAVVRRLVKY